MMKQVLCVWFPNWPIQRRYVERPELRRVPVLLHSPLESRAPHIQACCERAARRHVRPGMPVAEAQTLVRRGCFDRLDPASDIEQLRRLAWQCQAFTPCAGLDSAPEPECLFLDVTGCDAHFGGLESLCRHVAQNFEQQGYSVRIAAAPTLGAAWALAHFESRPRRGKSRPPTITLVSNEELSQRLARLPVQALRLSTEILTLLSECGLKTIGRLLDLPRGSLPSRFGPQLLLRLDQAFGEAEELVQPDLPPVPVRAEQQFEFLLTEPDEVLQALQELLQEVGTQLAQRRRETQQAHIGWRFEDGRQGKVEIRLLRPTLHMDRLWELISLKLETLQLSMRIDTLWLEAVPCPPPPPHRMTLFDMTQFDEGGTGHAEFLRLIERLSGRLGEQSVVRYRPVAEAQPELAWVAEPWLSVSQEGIAGSLPPERLLPQRPLRLLAEPVPLRVVSPSSSQRLLRFRWQEQDYTVAQLWGPERIVTGWWRSGMARRDYYRVETTSAARFWLFCERERERWFLQGIFD